MKGMIALETNKAANRPEFDEIEQTLDRGIDDMETGRELLVDEAFDLIADLVERRKRARA